MDLAIKDVKWKPLLTGHIAIGHRPGAKLLTQLKTAGCTHVVSLLSAREGGKPDRDLCLPLESATPPARERWPEVLVFFGRLRDALEHGARIYIHCSAGIHRTGMITYAFLRWLGQSREQAMAMLRELREITAQQAGENRLAWGDALVEYAKQQ